MELRQIHFFLAAARSLNFTSAANELQISQATLSRHISAMESELNLLLFIRDNRNVRLTSCGEYLYREFTKFYENYQCITENAKRIFAGYNGELTFGVLEEIKLETYLRDSLFAYQHDHPNHTLDFCRRSFKGITDGLLDASLDFGITFFFDIADITSLNYRVISHVTDGIVISSRHPLAHKKVFYPEDFKNQTFIIISKLDSHNAERQAIDYCMQHGFYPKLRVAPNLDTAMLWVEAGIGLAFTFSEAISVLNPSMTFIPFAPDAFIPGSMLVLAWNETNTNPAIPVFLKEFEKRSRVH